MRRFIRLAYLSTSGAPGSVWLRDDRAKGGQVAEKRAIGKTNRF